MKQNHYKKNILSLITVCAGALFLLTSCETEYNTTYVSGDAGIKSFTVQAIEGQEPIQAAIVNDTIKILWTSYNEMPKNITPTIEISDKAAISPKTGVEIPFKTGEKYTVTSEAGVAKQYTLQIDFRQPQPKILASNPTTAFKGEWLTYPADNLWINLEQTRVYLVSATDKTTEYDCEIAYFGKGTGVNPFRTYGIYFHLPTNLPLGKYDLRMKNGEYTLIDPNENNRFNLTITEPTELVFSIFTPYPLTAAAGGTFSIRGTKLDTGDDIYVSIGDTGTRYPLEIVSRTAYAVTFKVPAATPAGAYNMFIFVSSDGTEAMTYNALTVTN